MTATEYRDGLAQDAALVVGMPVTVRWGHGLGFRAQGTGVITAIYAKSVRVRLVDAVPSPHDPTKAGWSAGFELRGIPRFANERWDAWNSVGPA